MGHTDPLTHLALARSLELECQLALLQGAPTQPRLERVEWAQPGLRAPHKGQFVWTGCRNQPGHKATDGLGWNSAQLCSGPMHPRNQTTPRTCMDTANLASASDLLAGPSKTATLPVWTQVSGRANWPDSSTVSLK